MLWIKDTGWDYFTALIQSVKAIFEMAEKYNMKLIPIAKSKPLILLDIEEESAGIAQED